MSKVEILPDGRKKVGTRIYPKRKTEKFPFPEIRKKRGEYNPVTDLYFERYNRNPYGIQEVWVTKQKFDALTAISRESARRRSLEDPKGVARRKKEWKLAHPESVKASNKKASIKRRSTDVGRMICNLRSRTSMFISSNGMESVSVTEFLGCSFEELMAHLESYFQPGMTRKNYGMGKGKWCVDHHIPLISAKNEDEVKALVHYKNLRPLWWLDNLIKKDKMPESIVIDSEPAPSE